MRSAAIRRVIGTNFFSHEALMTQLFEQNLALIDEGVHILRFIGIISFL
jgi:hypothetical protein